MSRLRSLRDELKRPVRAKATLEGYADDWRLFVRWCAECGRESLPASEDTVGLYVTWALTTRNLKVSTVSRHVAAIAHFHREHSCANPLSRDTRSVLSSVKRQRQETPQGKASLDRETLASAAELCDPETNQGARNRGILVLGFATGLRRSELARLQLADVTFHKRGLAVFVRMAKNDQGGRGRFIAVWAGKRSCTDPVRVIRSWIERRGRWDGPLFCRIQRHDVIKRLPITGEAILDVVKNCISRAGLDPSPYGAHSLRAGAITASAEIGRSDREIMQLSGHRDRRVMGTYVRRSRLFAGRNPLAGVL